ncbi:54S ribosomal protein L28 mitochondrial [Spathaspora sp. JA1]|nr:54S ribosomal protein L28 mitochondrial [Spathaspora sp. JA1]
MFKSLVKPKSVVSTVLTFTRGKRIAAINPATERIVQQLSVLAAGRKQPKLLNLSNEDIIKHRTIMNAWKVFSSGKKRAEQTQLAQQYESICNAMNDLKETSPKLFNLANKKDKKSRFPLEMRFPTEYPPNRPWVYNYTGKKRA